VPDTIKLSDNDVSLVKKAKALHPDDWWVIDTMELQAESVECRAMLNVIQKSKYHIQEGYDI